MIIELFKRFILIAVGVLLSTHLVEGISYDTGGDLLLAVVVLSLLNIFIKPIVILFTLPFVILSFGLGILIINGIFFIIVGTLVSGFHVDGYWAAFWGALIVSALSLLANIIFDQTKKSHSRTKKIKDDDAIDLDS